LDSVKIKRDAKLDNLSEAELDLIRDKIKELMVE